MFATRLSAGMALDGFIGQLKTTSLSLIYYGRPMAGPSPAPYVHSFPAPRYACPCPQSPKTFANGHGFLCFSPYQGRRVSSDQFQHYRHALNLPPNVPQWPMDVQTIYLPARNPLYLPALFLSELFTRLSRKPRSVKIIFPNRCKSNGRRRPMLHKQTHLRRLSYFRPNDLPLIVLVVLDRLQQGRALFDRQSMSPMNDSRSEANEVADLIIPKLRVVHVLNISQRGSFDGKNESVVSHLIPMLLHAPLRSRRELLCDLTPAGALIAQMLEPLLFRRRPWRVCSAFLGYRTRQLALLEAKSDVDICARRKTARKCECAGIAARRSGELDLGCSALARVVWRLRGRLLLLELLL